MRLSGCLLGDPEDADNEAAAATLSEDGSTITWKILSSTVTLGGNGNFMDGFQVTIGGIKANASTVGDGEDIVAVVSVAGSVAHSGVAQTRGRDNRSDR